MNFSEAMKELLAGKTIRRISKKRWEERDEPEEFIRDVSIVDGRFRFVAWQKKRGEDGEFWVEDALVQNPASRGDSVFFSIDEVLAEDWHVVGATHPAASALQAFLEGKWVRHKSWNQFVRRIDPMSDKGSLATCAVLNEHFAREPYEFCEKAYNYWGIKFKDFFKESYGWIISDKDFPCEYYSEEDE